jgi:abortive infection bacteriophage resistance protein
MKYDKLPLSFEEQADRLIRRGLVVDKNLLVARLKNVNYYRLSGYLYPYRQPDDTFKPGTTSERAWRHYTFDRRLRFIVMDAIERVEVSVRTQLIYALAHNSGAFGYTKPESLPKLTEKEYSRGIHFLKPIWEEYQKKNQRL